jgi:hypothetical protein
VVLRTSTLESGNVSPTVRIDSRRFPPTFEPTNSLVALREQLLAID